MASHRCRADRKNRLAHLAIFLAGGSILFVALLLVNRDTRFEVTTYEVRSSRVPDAFDGFCIVQVSDLHSDTYGANQSDLLRSVGEAHPDLVAITGDLINRSETRSDFSLLLQLAAFAPVYFVTGNHEIHPADAGYAKRLRDDIESTGAHFLQGEAATIQRGEEAIVVAGIDDLDAFLEWRKPWTLKAAEQRAVTGWSAALASLRRGISPDKFVLLLSHRPEFFDFYAAAQFDLVLAGHAHGGQVRLPLLGPLYAPGQGWLPRYTSGVHRRDMTAMVVSRGLKKSLFPIRLFNRPELVVVHLRKE